jgi:probable F420-dependent oxidoreductase
VSEETLVNLSFSVELPTTRVDHPAEFVSGDAVMEVAATAEAAGFAGVHVTDHPAGDARWLDAGGHHALDPFVALSFAAAATHDLRLLTYVYIAAYRNPFLGAKAVLSLDVLSGGRVTLGTAAGYLKPEFAALGVDFDERNDLFDENLEVMKRAWSGDDVEHEGPRFRARGVRMRPLPVHRPHPPIWIGGNSARSVRRAVESAQGWAPFNTFGYAQASRTAEIDDVEQLASRIDDARSYAAEIGRTEPLDICFSGGPVADEELPLAERRSEAQRLGDAGVTWIAVALGGDDRQQLLDSITRFGDEVIAG